MIVSSVPGLDEHGFNVSVHLELPPDTTLVLELIMNPEEQLLFVVTQTSVLSGISGISGSGLVLRRLS